MRGLSSSPNRRPACPGQPTSSVSHRPPRLAVRCTCNILLRCREQIGGTEQQASVGVLQHSHVETGAEYHRADEAHHVHLTCRNCGQDDELSLEEARKLQGLIKRHHGFVADLTHFAITGLCRDCAA